MVTQSVEEGAVETEVKAEADQMNYQTGRQCIKCIRYIKYHKIQHNLLFCSSFSIVSSNHLRRIRWDWDRTNAWFLQALAIMDYDSLEANPPDIFTDSQAATSERLGKTKRASSQRMQRMHSIFAVGNRAIVQSMNLSGRTEYLRNSKSKAWSTIQSTC